MAIRASREMEAAMRRAGILPTAAAKPGRAIKPLPAECLLLDGPAAGPYEVEVRGWHPARLNELVSMHWAKAGRRKYLDACTIGRELRRAGVPRAGGKRRVALVIVLGPRGRGGDGDAYWKSSLDGLKRCGALVDDNRHFCELTPLRYERQGEASTRIILEDL